MYKNQLQELAQRSCFNLPSYSCVREGPDHAPRFKATVNFNGETFESPTFCPTLRLAEHAAAEVALNNLANRGPSKTLASKVLDETGIYKNLLQETAHRAGLQLPLYSTIRSGPGHVPVFSCTVELAGMTFPGEPARTKKQAQKNAAMAAWMALKQLAQSRSPSSASTSSSSSQVDGNDEQDQVIIARILASSQLPEPKSSSSQIDHQRTVSSHSSQNPSSLPPPSYPVQHERWAYSNIPTEIAVYQLFQQQAYMLQYQTRLVPLPLGPPMQPVPIRHGSTIPTLVPPSYPPRVLVHSPIRGSSTVKIQEIEEKTDGSSSLRMSETGAVVQEQFHDRQTQIPFGSNRLNVNRPQPPVMGSSSVGPRNQNFGSRASAPLLMRTGASANMARPVMGYGGVPLRSMVPAVQIRSVAPVCSAPPVTMRKMQNTSQVAQSSDQEKGIGREDDNVSDASHGVGKLQI